jgi:hypothetical protein
MDTETDYLRLTLLRGILAGVANASTIIYTNPLDVLKIRFQLGSVDSLFTYHLRGEGRQSKIRTRSTWNKALSIVRKEGFLGLYKGLSISIIRELTFSSG